MAGHSKWHNIKHRKAAADAKKGKIWSKCSKAIMAAARTGGPDPATNLQLRYAIDEARYANMPRDTIERAVKKGAGELGGESFEAIRYEGYGPSGVAVIVEALTDNRTRTASDIRYIFNRYGGNLGQTGCVSFMFEQKGLIFIPADAGEERVMEAALAAGAEDVSPPGGEDGEWTVTTTPTEFLTAKDAIEAAGLTVSDARLDMIPTNTVSVSGDDARSLLKLIEALEDNDDVQKVYANFDIPDEELAVIE